MSPSTSRVANRFLQAGASDFVVYSAGKDAKAAFREAVADARHESGHGGYSGTIAEKSSFILRSSTPMTRNQARAFIDKDIERNDKHDPAFAVPIIDEQVVDQTEVTVTVSAKSHAEASKLAVEAITLSGGKGAVTVDIKGSPRKLSEGGKPKVSLDRTQAKTYYQYGASGAGWSQRPDRKAVLEAGANWLAEPHNRVGERVALMKVEVFGHLVKEAEASQLPTWEVTGLRKDVTLGEVKGYMFYGSAAS